MTSNRYYALNDRTINLLMKGYIDMSAVTDSNSAEDSNSNKERDGEVQEWLDTETNVEFFAFGKNKTRSGGAFFPYPSNTIYDLYEYGIFKTINKFKYQLNCLYLQLLASVLELH